MHRQVIHVRFDFVLHIAQEFPENEKNKIKNCGTRIMGTKMLELDCFAFSNKKYRK